MFMKCSALFSGGPLSLISKLSFKVRDDCSVSCNLNVQKIV